MLSTAPSAFALPLDDECFSVYFFFFCSSAPIRIQVVGGVANLALGAFTYDTGCPAADKIPKRQPKVVDGVPVKVFQPDTLPFHCKCLTREWLEPALLKLPRPEFTRLVVNVVQFNNKYAWADAGGAQDTFNRQQARVACV